MIQSIDWAAIGPPLALIAAAVLALLGDAFVPRLTRVLPVTVSLVGVVAAFALTWSLGGESRAAFCQPGTFERPIDCSWIVDDVTIAWWVLVIVSVGLIVLLVQPSIVRGELPAGECLFLVLTSAAGALCLAASLDLITLVVSMETVSLPAFALVGLRRSDRAGSEAALKFFIASVVATAVTLLGISFVYGATGSVAAGSVATWVATDAALEPVVGVGMVLTVVGLAFKVAAVPFQVWVPDTYVGAPIPVAAYLSVVSKAAGLAGLVIVLTRFFPTSSDTWTPVVAVAAALTMTLGNLAALRQKHVVRLLAWSSVAQAGYLLVPLAAGGSDVDTGALQAYALMYAIVNVGAFAAVVAVSAWGRVNVDDLTGLARSHPLLGVALGFALLCLAGLPPGVVGLLAKVVVFQSAVDGNLTWLAVVMAVNVAIGLVYYLRVLVAIVAPAPERSQDSPERSQDSPEWSQDSPERSQDSPERSPGSAVPAPVMAVVALTFTAALALSVAPAPLFSVIP